MSSKNPPTRIIVIGGGISGLAAAHQIVEHNPSADVTLLEASDRIGGVIHTIEKDGFSLETGPDNFVTNKPWCIALCKRVGLEEQIQPTSDAFRRAMIVRDGRLLPIPEGFLMLAPTKILPIVTSKIFSWPGKIRMAMEVFIPANPAEKDESLASFVTRRLGQEALDRIVQPLIGGIYTADPKKLSLGATMPMFLKMERKGSSLIRAMRKSAKRSTSTASGARYSLFVSLKDGMSALPHQLASRIGEKRIRLNSCVRTLTRENEAWAVTLQDGLTLQSDRVIITGQ
jgi:oxygen-dependent protoporphyrinogen oxidase